MALQGHVAAMVDRAGFTEEDCFFEFHYKVERYYRDHSYGAPRWMLLPPIVTDRPGYESVTVRRWEYSPCGEYVLEPHLPHMSRCCALVCH